MEIKIGEKVFGDLQYDLYPKLVKVRQNFESVREDHIEKRIEKEIMKEEIAGTIHKGDSIAVLVGSRGIANIREIVFETIQQLKCLGAKPFIVPAMASHGGATEQGQMELLESYGITEEFMGVEIRSTMLPKYIGTTSSGVKIYFDVNALYADGVVPINRIKAHTAFRGKSESGLIKMCTIGAGKQKGAESLHSHGADTFATLLPEAFEIVRKKAKILFGMGIVENAYEETAIIEAIPAEKIYDREVELLQKANQYMAKILIDKFDCLIVGETGKNISGDGMDPNIMGRFAVPGMQGGPKYQRMAVLDVTEESHGNAVGIGLADVIPKKILEKANFAFMYMNAFTSKMVIPIVKIPMVAADDREAIGVMLRTCVRVEIGKEKVIYIKNTLDLGEIWVSESLAEELKGDERFEILSEPMPMQFDTEGNLIFK
ncbi:MAG: hypothetical protein KHY31_12380 [Clostridiales bacterium]|nr:hypothetical protein [Clostridiales bacterium]